MPLPAILPRTLDGVSLTTVAGVVLVLLALDVVGTIVLASAVSGRSRSGTIFSGDWDLGGAAGKIYNRLEPGPARCMDFTYVTLACRDSKPHQLIHLVCPLLSSS